MAPLRVAIADDSALFRTALRQLLETIPGVAVVAEVGTGVEALQILQDTIPNLLILDVQMPEMNGLEVLRRLQERGDGVRVLVLTAYTSDRYQKRAIESGAVAYVNKGNVQLLIDTIKGLMQEG